MPSGTYNPATGTFVTSNTGAALQGGGAGGGISLQGGSGAAVQNTIPVQKTVSGLTLQGSQIDPNTASFGAPAGGQTTTFDPAAAAAAAAAAAEAARLAAARGDVTNRVQQIKDIYNGRYGKVDSIAQEQTGQLNNNFSRQSGEIADQTNQANDQISAAHAAAGSYDSSYRGDNVDTQTKIGKNQVDDLGTQLQGNLANVGKWLVGQKSGFDAQKSSMDNVIAHLADEKNPDNLVSLRNQLDAQIATLKGQEGDYNTSGANAQALAAIAPVDTRAAQLKTNLASIIAGTSDPSMKKAIGSALIQNSALTPEEQQQLLSTFAGDVDKTKQTTA